ncbi:Uncharacterised protein [Vibrio cholerae]|nr:Uncharacterised protein [Vibrio cholerae]
MPKMSRSAYSASCCSRRCFNVARVNTIHFDEFW